MLLVNLVPNLLAVQRIAFFGGNVHILYVAEMAQNSRVLLLMWRSEHPEKGKISRCIVQFGEIQGYGRDCRKTPTEEPFCSFNSNFFVPALMTGRTLVRLDHFLIF